MEVDAKTLATVAVAVLGGGGAGFGVSEVRTEVQLAQQQVQIDNMREIIISRIAEHKSDQGELKVYMEGLLDDVNARIDRLDARKADK